MAEVTVTAQQGSNTLRLVFAGLLSCLAAYLAVVPVFPLAHIELSLLDAPLLLLLLLVGLRPALLLWAVVSVAAAYVWGIHDPYLWISTFLNALLMLLAIAAAGRWLPSASVAEVGMTYWLFIGFPVAFLCRQIETDQLYFVVDDNAVQSFISASWVLLGGTISVWLAATLRFVVLYLNPSMLFRYGLIDAKRSALRVREVSEMAFLSIGFLPVLTLLLITGQDRIEDRFQSMLAVAEARFESLAFTAERALDERDHALNILLDSIVELPGDDDGYQPIEPRFETLLNRHLKVTDARGLIVVDGDGRYFSSAWLQQYQGEVKAALESTTWMAGQKATSIEIDGGLVELSLLIIGNPSERHLILVFVDELAVWNYLYGHDALGLATAGQSAGVLSRVSHFHDDNVQALYGIALDSDVVREEYDYLQWLPASIAASLSYRAPLLTIYTESRVTFQASDELIGAFDAATYDVDCFRFSVDYWSYLKSDLTWYSVWILVAVAMLWFIALCIGWLLGRFSAPLMELTAAVTSFVRDARLRAEPFSFVTQPGTHELSVLREGFKRMEVDVNEANRQLVQASKMATLGQMATGMAHELNQPLHTIILALANVRHQINSDAPKQDAINRKIQTIEAQVRRASGLIDHMKTYGRVSSGEQGHFSPWDIVTEIEELWQRQFSVEGCELICRYAAAEALIVFGGRNEFEQVLLNIINNARDAIKSRGAQGEIRITVSKRDDQCVITASDSGGGIPEEIIDRVFEPFFTTKAPNEGTGLGLSVSYGIVEDMGGHITVKNTELGAEFEMTLPLISPDTLVPNPDIKG
jgi:signal transduction histidine kinase/uncharacterized membrane protein YqjE